MVIIIGMDVDGFLASLESLKLATGIRDSLYLFPLIESFHVLGLSVVFGSIVIVDPRLLGIASIRRSFTRVTSDILRWTWAAFGWTATTGIMIIFRGRWIGFNTSQSKAPLDTGVNVDDLFPEPPGPTK